MYSFYHLKVQQSPFYLPDLIDFQKQGFQIALLMIAIRYIYSKMVEKPLFNALSDTKFPDPKVRAERAEQVGIMLLQLGYYICTSYFGY